jgi:hypothetical protein
MNEKLKKKMANVIGENLDKVISIDWRGSGFIHPLYDILRKQTDRALTINAASMLSQRVKEGDVVFILTGFPVGPFDVIREGKEEHRHEFESDILSYETDGPVAAAMLARAIDIGFKAKPIILSEDDCVPIVNACCNAAGLRVMKTFEKSKILSHSVTVLGFTKDLNEAKKLASELVKKYNPAAAVSIERPGRNEKGHYHMANGRAITDFVAKLDEVFEAVAAAGGLTVAIGDLGNELGMGALKEATQKIIFYGKKCRCGCGGGVGSAFKAEATIFGSVSDDVAYAFIAALAYLLEKPDLLQSTDMQRRVLEASATAGAIDGPSGLTVPWIDFLDLTIHNHQIELMREIISAPERFFKLQPFFYGVCSVENLNRHA